jgi:phosphoribosylformimino-5-aminoimidazole carboxamide ribonucleotide (ProFAR) isomerase
MLLVIPEIQLINGECKRSIVGENGTEAFYRHLSQNPDELCSLLRRENAKSIHVLDVDSMLGHDNNLNLNMILFLAQAVDIPIQVYSNFMSAKECYSLLNNGVYRIIIDELAYLDPGGVSDMIKTYTPSRVVCYLYTKGGKLIFDKADVSVSDYEFAQYVKTLGANRVIYGDEDWERKGSGPDLPRLIEFAAKTGMRVTIANGISKPEQLWEINKLIGAGIDSAILGKSLYTNSFPCQKIWRKIEAELEPGLINGSICQIKK